MIFYLFSAFHREWNARVEVRHPSLWHFMRKLKDQQVVSARALEAAQRGDPPARRRRKWRILEARIQRVRQQYADGHRTLEELWDASVYMMGHFRL